MKNKKAISPLIATVLLIAATISLAYIVSQWSTIATKRVSENVERFTSEDIYCGSVAIIAEICKKNDEYKITVINKGEITINQIYVRHEGGIKKILNIDLQPTKNHPPISISDKPIDVLPFVKIEDQIYGCVNKRYKFTEEELDQSCPTT